MNHAGFVLCQAVKSLQSAASGSRDGGGVRLVAIFNAVRFA
jgi:hypothetical protein